MTGSSQGETMHQLSTRLEDLKREFSTGQARLTRLDEERANLRDTLLRISGAIQVLEEMLVEAPGGPGHRDGNGDRPGETPSPSALPSAQE